MIQNLNSDNNVSADGDVFYHGVLKRRVSFCALLEAEAKLHDKSFSFLTVRKVNGVVCLVAEDGQIVRHNLPELPETAPSIQW